ncbi:MAG: A24 family peptidase [Hyphomicrobium sp.]|nr:A24 family peptidase [Hyphomicrobium sp.]
MTPGNPDLIANEASRWLTVTLVGLYAALAAPALLTGPPLALADIAPGCFLAALLIALSAIDLRSYRLPDYLTLPLGAAGVAAAHWLGWETGMARLLAAVIAFLSLLLVRAVYFQVRGRHGLGLGDAKLFAAIAAWTGVDGLAAILLYASGLALLAAIYLAATGRHVSAHTALPFGPFLGVGGWLVWLYGPPL